MSRKTQAHRGSAVGQLFDTAVALHREGQLQRAEVLYRDVLRQQADHADALNMLGVIGCQTGNLQAGMGLIRRALAVQPRNPDYHNNLGMAALELRDHDAAVRAFEQAVKANPRFAEGWFNLANAELARAHPQAAEKAYRKALRVRPDYADALNNLANLLRQDGRAVEAAQLLRRLVRLQPRFAPAHLNLGLALAACGNFDEAVDSLRSAAALDAALAAEAWTHVGRCERRRGALDASAAAYREALAAGTPTAARWNALGAVQFAAGDIDEAARSFEQALAIDADSADALDNLGLVWAARGDRTRAASNFERALACQPAHGAAWRDLAALEHEPAAARALAERLEAALAALPDTAPARVPMGFALGRLADLLGDYEQAFAAFAAANAMRRANTPYDGAAQARFIDSLMQVFDDAFFASQTEPASDSERPLFIVGLPRSGTSLVEQILASHPQIHGAGELTFFPERVARLPAMLGSKRPFPQCVTSDCAALAPLAADYLALLEARGGNARRVTDKMPYNFLYLGLIAALFPRARVIHCRRDAMATCFSLFIHDLAGSHPYAYALEDLAGAYAGYERLMAHWRHCLPLAMLEIDYEALVDDPDAGARALVEFSGLPFDAACLDFHHNPRAVTTASQWQVRQPVYATAKSHWMRYSAQLEPLAAALAAARAH